MLIHDFKERVKAGEKKTRGQWAEAIYGEDNLYNRSRIGGMISRLRKQGEMIFPIKLEGERERYVAYVNKNETLFTASVNTYTRENVQPRLKNTFHMMEVLLAEFPETLTFIQSHAKSLMNLALEHERHLLNVPYVKPSEHKTLK